MLGNKVYVCMCVSVCVSEERQIDTNRKGVTDKMRERERVCVCVCVCECERDRESVCVCNI